MLRACQSSAAPAVSGDREFSHVEVRYLEYNNI